MFAISDRKLTIRTVSYSFARCHHQFATAVGRSMVSCGCHGRGQVVERRTAVVAAAAAAAAAH